METVKEKKLTDAENDFIKKGINANETQGLSIELLPIFFRRDIFRCQKEGLLPKLSLQFNIIPKDKKITLFATVAGDTSGVKKKLSEILSNYNFTRTRADGTQEFRFNPRVCVAQDNELDNYPEHLVA